MIRKLARFRGPFIFLVICALSASPISALKMVEEVSLPLKETDQILGSMRNNFLLYSKPYIRMYNSRLIELFSMKLSNNVKPTLSPNAEHLGLITYADRSPTDMRTVKFERYDRLGKFIWKMDNPAPNEFLLSNTGRIFGIEGVAGMPSTKIHLYDQYGELVNILTIPEYHGILISPAGSKFLVDNAGNGLVVYDTLGEKLAALPASTHYLFDKDDRYIGIFFQGIFRLFQDEKEVQTIKTDKVVIRDMAIDVEHNVFVALAVNHIMVYELTTGKLLWQYEVSSSSKFFTKVDLSDDGEFFVCGLDINFGKELPKDVRHREGYLYLAPTNGKMMVQFRTTYNIWGAGLPRGRFTAARGSLFLVTKEEIKKLWIK